MFRKDALSGLTLRLTARRDALRKTLDGELESFLKFSEEIEVGDQVDSANDAICSQLVEIDSQELAQIEHALQRIAGAFTAVASPVAAGSPRLASTHYLMPTII
jgi:DnaK suppressor protein